jgi:hypothetical protein
VPEIKDYGVEASCGPDTRNAAGEQIRKIGHKDMGGQIAHCQCGLNS